MEGLRNETLGSIGSEIVESGLGGGFRVEHGDVVATKESVNGVHIFVIDRLGEDKGLPIEAVLRGLEGMAGRNRDNAVQIRGPNKATDAFEVILLLDSEANDEGTTDDAIDANDSVFFVIRIDKRLNHSLGQTVLISRLADSPGGRIGRAAVDGACERDGRSSSSSRRRRFHGDVTTIESINQGLSGVGVAENRRHLKRGLGWVEDGGRGGFLI